MIDELDVHKPLPAPPTMAGFYRTLGVPAFWEGARAVREAEFSHGDAVHRIEVLRQAAEAGVPMAGVPELREWQAHGR